jgi:nitronate monooxygenase
VIAAGLDPDNLPSQEKRAMSFGNRKSAEIAKAWRDIWGGQSLGAIGDVLPASEVIARMRAEYLDARREFCTSAIAQALESSNSQQILRLQYSPEYNEEEG